MSKKKLMMLVDTLDTRSYQDDGVDTTFFEVSQGGKVLATLAMAGPTSMFLWSGKPKGRNGLLATRNRSTMWDQNGFDFARESQRLLYRMAAQVILKAAE